MIVCCMCKKVEGVEICVQCLKDYKERIAQERSEPTAVPRSDREIKYEKLRHGDPCL